MNTNGLPNLPATYVDIFDVNGYHKGSRLVSGECSRPETHQNCNGDAEKRGDCECPCHSPIEGLVTGQMSRELQDRIFATPISAAPATPQGAERGADNSQAGTSSPLKHTPGPWSVWAFDDGNELAVGPIVGGVAVAHIVTVNGHGIATESTATTAQANATMIANAPELLKACKRSIELLKACGANVDENEPILAVIAAAEGRLL